MDPIIVAAIITGTATVFAAILGLLIKDDKIIFTNWVRWRRNINTGIVILINGGSGVGKTSVAWALARKFNIVSVIGTDILREAARYYEDKSGNRHKNPIFFSSFENETDQPTVLESFVQQCRDLTPPLVRVINRIRKKRDPVIIEGVNIIASEIFKRIPHDDFNRVIFINLHLNDESTHMKRLRTRGIKSNEPPEETDRYIQYINNIREIDMYLNADCRQMCQTKSPLIIIENSKNISAAIDSIEKQIKPYLKKFMS